MTYLGSFDALSQTEHHTPILEDVSILESSASLNWSIGGMHPVALSCSVCSVTCVFLFVLFSVIRRGARLEDDVEEGTSGIGMFPWRS